MQQLDHRVTAFDAYLPQVPIEPPLGKSVLGKQNPVSAQDKASHKQQDEPEIIDLSADEDQAVAADEKSTIVHMWSLLQPSTTS